MRRDLVRARGPEFPPTRGESRANQRQRLDPGGRLGPNERGQRFRPFRDLPDAARDRRNCEVERHHQNQQQHDGHQRDGEAAPTAKPRLRVQQERPRSNRDRGRPDQRDQKWSHDPEARADQGRQGKQLEGGTREIRRSVRIHFLTPPKSTRHGVGFGSLASAMRIAIPAAVRKSRARYAVPCLDGWVWIREMISLHSRQTRSSAPCRWT